MIEPAPTTRIAPDLARGIFDSRIAETATTPEFVVLRFLNTSYKLHLRPGGTIGVEEGKRVIGRIHASAKRIDVVGSGGRYVEPVIGRPRRVQGSIIAVDATANTVTVSAGVPIICKVTAPGQKASGFVVGQFVSFDVLRGAEFHPVQG